MKIPQNYPTRPNEETIYRVSIENNEIDVISIESGRDSHLFLLQASVTLKAIVSSLIFSLHFQLFQLRTLI